MALSHQQALTARLVALAHSRHFVELAPAQPARPAFPPPTQGLGALTQAALQSRGGAALVQDCVALYGQLCDLTRLDAPDLLPPVGGAPLSITELLSRQAADALHALAPLLLPVHRLCVALQPCTAAAAGATLFSCGNCPCSNTNCCPRTAAPHPSKRRTSA